MGYEYVRDLGPGEVVRITADGIHQVTAPGKRKQICSFLWVYYGYPSAWYEGINVEDCRYACGAAMARRDHDVEPDFVAGIPDSGVGHAIGYSNEKNIPYKDFGCPNKESCDYPIFAGRLCVGIQEGKAPLGILVCGTGIGMSLAANKHKGIRAACCSDTFSARLTREHNDANVLCFGSRVVGMGLAFDLVDNFLTAEYQGGKHAKRVDMITAVENGNILL